MTSKNKQALRPGEIRLDYLPLDWPLTPLGENKDPTSQVGRINRSVFARLKKKHLLTAVKPSVLLGGPVYNQSLWLGVGGH
jgi:hypothetical protein